MPLITLLFKSMPVEPKPKKCCILWILCQFSCFFVLHVDRNNNSALMFQNIDKYVIFNKVAL